MGTFVKIGLEEHISYANIYSEGSPRVCGLDGYCFKNARRFDQYFIHCHIANTKLIEKKDRSRKRK